MSKKLTVLEAIMELQKLQQDTTTKQIEVECINTKNLPFLTQFKKYTLEEEKGPMFCIIDDSGKKTIYSKNLFISY